MKYKTDRKQKIDGWISVYDKMPPQGEAVQTLLINYRPMTIRGFDVSELYDDSFASVQRVFKQPDNLPFTHWKPVDNNETAKNNLT